MRRRITFLHKPEDAIDPKTIDVGANTFSFSGLKAAREDRVTLGLDDLPEDIRLVLEQSHELHIRYTSPTSFETASPLLSRLAPGLHVYYSPQRSSKARPDLLCDLLHDLFESKDKSTCQTPEESFTSLPSQRFHHSTDYEYYQPHSEITVSSLRDKLAFSCHASDKSCQKHFGGLFRPDSIDIDYDTISHILNVKIFWQSRNWDFDISNDAVNDRIEVGLLSKEKPVELEELKLGGFLTVVGEDEKPSATLFSFPARHHSHSAEFSTSFLKPTGLHPTLQLEISNSSPPAGHDTCSLHAHLSLPRVIFADKYQLSDPLFMAAKNLSTLRYITSPVDLEAPEYAMKIWGSSVLLELAPPEPSSRSWTAEVPLHLRYLKPSDTGYREISVPSPVLFWACTAEEGSKFTINPFDRVNLGYDGLFGPRTMFYHLAPSADARSYNEIQVPVFDIGYSGLVESGTTIVILAGFLWVTWKIIWVLFKEGYGKHPQKHQKKE